MAKAAILVLAGNDTHADRGRVFNALETATEFHENDENYRLIFDGAGTEWIPELVREDHDFHELYQAVRKESGVCSFCADAFGVGEEVEDSGVTRLDEYEGHPSVYSLVQEGYEVITY